jgi:hypothetical protein
MMEGVNLTKIHHKYFVNDTMYPQYNKNMIILKKSVGLCAAFIFRLVTRWQWKFQSRCHTVPSNSCSGAKTPFCLEASSHVVLNKSEPQTHS